MKKVLWLGPIVNPDNISDHKAVSPAANKWQINFINALQRNDVQIVNLSYLPEPKYPKGKLFPIYKHKVRTISNVQSKYINIPFIKNRSLSNSLKKNITKFKTADIIITYNSYVPHINAAKYAVSKYNMKWVNIVADDQCVEGPDLTVFLSYGYYHDSDISSKMHIDGGLYSLESTTDKFNKNVLIFTGALNKWTGIEKFAHDFSKLNIDKFELHIFGKGNSLQLTRLAQANRNIKIKGFVSEEELESNMKKCFAFVNPRPIDIDGSENNFPSKLLEYFKYGKPILSTKTAGVAPYYDDLLMFYDPNNLNSLDNALKILTNFTEEDRCLLRKRISDFSKSHSWDSLAKLFIESI